MRFKLYLQKFTFFASLFLKYSQKHQSLCWYDALNVFFVCSSDRTSKIYNLYK